MNTEATHQVAGSRRVSGGVPVGRRRLPLSILASGQSFTCYQAQWAWRFLSWRVLSWRGVGSALRPCGARLTFAAAGTLAADHGGIAAYAGHNFYYAEVGSPEVGGATYR